MRQDHGGCSETKFGRVQFLSARGCGEFGWVWFCMGVSIGYGYVVKLVSEVSGWFRNSIINYREV